MMDKRQTHVTRWSQVPQVNVNVTTSDTISIKNNKVMQAINRIVSFKVNKYEEFD